MLSNTEQLKKSLIPKEELDSRRAAETKRNRAVRTGRRALAGAGVVVALLGANHYLNQQNHIQSADTLAAVKAEVGHIPAGLEMIQKINNEGLARVKYVVQPNKAMVSFVAADLHPVAPNQDLQSEFSAIETYTGGSVINPGEEIDMLVNTNSGEILANPAGSAETNG